MENIKLWILSVCIFSVIISIYRILLPNGNIKKAGVTVLSILLIFVMVKPLLTAKDKEFAFDIGDDLFSEAETLNEKNIYKEAIIKTVSNELEKNSISFENITVDMNIASDSNIEIINICLSVNSDLTDDNIKQRLEDDTGFSKEIITIIR